MNKQFKDQTVIIVTHSTEVFGPPNALAEFVGSRGGTVLFIDHPLEYRQNRCSRFELWENGRKIYEESYPNWLSNPAVNYTKDFVVTCYALWRHARRRPIRYFIGLDSLSCLAGLCLRRWLSSTEFISYNADYSTRRFSSALLNTLYRWTDTYVTMRVDRIWCVTNRIVAIRRGQKPGAIVTHVPNGVTLDRLPKMGTHDKGLVFVGNLTPEKGVDQIIEALRQSESKLTIFGSGGEIDRLKGLVDQYQMKEQINFAGRVSNDEILQKLSGFTIGLALYRDSETYVYYSDPLKIKEYLAAGLPVITTALPEVASVIEKHEAGVIVKSSEDLASAIKIVLKKREHMSRQAQLLAKIFDWDTIFASAFAAK